MKRAALKYIQPIASGNEKPGSWKAGKPVGTFHRHNTMLPSHDEGPAK